MNVLFVYDSISPIGGGSQMSVFLWIKNLKKHGITAQLLCNENAKGFVPDSLVSSIIPLRYINLHMFFPYYYPSLPSLASLRKLLLTNRPDIIHLQEPSFLTLQIIRIAKREGIPVLFSFQTDMTKQSIAQFPMSFIAGKRGIPLYLQKLQYYFFSKSTALTAPTDIYYKILKHIVHLPVFLLPLPIADSFYTAEKKPSVLHTPLRLLTVSRLAGGKRLNVLIEAMRFVEGVQLQIIGDGPDREYLEKKIHAQNLENVIQLTGWADHASLHRIFSEADIFISPSDSETFGITYVEALASRLPCIVYDCPVAREVIPEGMAVFVPTLQPEKWAEEISYLQNKTIYAQFIRAIEKNYQKISAFREDNSTRILLSIYRSTLNSYQEKVGIQLPK